MSWRPSGALPRWHGCGWLGVITRAVSVAEISAGLGALAESFFRAYFSEGFRQGDYWQVGDTSGAAGCSLVIRLLAQDGRKAGGWKDYTTGEFGDLIDLLHAKLGSTSFKETITDGTIFLSNVTISTKPAPGQTLKGLVLPRFSSGLLRAMFAINETRNGNEIHRRVSA
jgi:hypothetical protein